MNESNTSSVLVTGASGRTGREILHELNGTSFHVRALTRSVANRESLREAGADEVVIGDLLHQSDARTAVKGCDGILFAAGSSLLTRLLRPSRVVDGDGVLNLVEAAVREGVGTFVLQSSIGVGDSRLGMPLWARLIVLRWTVREKERAEQALRDSELKYVVIRPGRLTDDPATGDLSITEGGGSTTGSVPRADVASLVVAALSTPDALNRTYEVVARDAVKRFDASSRTTVEWNRNVPSRT